MIVTEEEAKTKRCQESFPAAEGITLGGYTEVASLTVALTGMTSSFARQTAPLNCIGSSCMAWEWMPGRPDNATSGEMFKGYCGKVAQREKRE